MLTIRPLIFLFTLLVMSGLFAGCRRGNGADGASGVIAPGSAPGSTPGARTTGGTSSTGSSTAAPALSSAEIAELIRGLAAEEIVPGEAAGGMQLFAGEFDRYRCRASDELARLNAARVAPALKRAAGDADPVVRRNAAMTLARLGDAAGADVLYDLLDDEKTAPIIGKVIVDSLAALAEKGGPALRWSRVEPVFQRRQASGNRSRHLQSAILIAAARADDAATARRLVMANLHSRDVALRHAALLGAAEFDWPEDGLPEEAMEALHDRHPRVVLAAVALLSRHGRAENPAVAGRLAEMMRHGDARVRQSAVAAIIALKLRNSHRILVERLDDNDLRVQRDVVRAMAELNDLDGLRAALAVRRFRVRQLAAEVLGGLSAQALPLLKQAAGDDSFNVRRTVAESVLEIGDRRGAAIVVELLDDRAISVRVAAQRAYEELTGRRLDGYEPQGRVEDNAAAVDSARKFVESNLRQWTEQASDGVPVTDVVPHGETVALLLAGLALPEGSPERQLAAETLASLGRAAVPAVEQRIADQPAGVVEALLADILPRMDEAYGELRQLRQTGVDAIVRRRTALRLSELTSSRQLCPPAVAHMVEVLKAERDPVVRRLLGQRLLQWRAPGLGAAAAPGLTMDDAQSRQLAAIIVGMVRYGDAYGKLIALLADEAQQVRQAAAEALGRLGNHQAVPTLREKLITARAVTDRLAYGAALARLGDAGGRDELIRLLAETDESVRMNVIEAMGEAGDAAFVAPLIERLSEGDIGQTAAAIDALEQITGLSMGDPRSPIAVRRQTIARWRRWFEREIKVVSP